MFELDFGARVDRGLVRKANQDVARVAPRQRLALVADGMGGHAHGDVASRIAAEALEQSFANLGGPGEDVDDTAERLQSSFREANQRVADHPSSGEGRAKMGTTLVAAVFAHGRAVIGNVGDSRCYRLRDGELEPLTEDHSCAAQLRQEGLIATPDGSDAPQRWAHVLTRCINGEEGATADIRIERCEPGDVFLLCSDGLWGSVAGDVIGAILGATEDADEACERLVGAAWAGGGADNIGLAVVRLVPSQLRLDKPSGIEPSLRQGELPAGEA